MSATSASTTATQTKQPNHFQNYFSNLVFDLLDQLVYSFEDCKSTLDMRKAFVTHIKGNDKNEAKMIRNWHRVMSQYYRELVQDPLNVFDEILDVMKDTGANIDDTPVNDVIANMVMAKMTNNIKEFDRLMSLLHDPIYFLKQLKLREKWRDPSFDDDSRRYIVCYMLHLNGFAILHDLISDDLFQIAQTEGTKVISEMGGVAPGNAQAVLLETYNKLPKESLQPFVENMPMFMLSVSSLAGAGLEGGNMLMSLLESSGPLAEQLGPMKNMLKMVMPMLGNIRPDAFDNMAQVMQNPMFQNLLSSNGQMSNLDPNMLQSLMNPEMLGTILQNMQGPQK